MVPHRCWDCLSLTPTQEGRLRELNGMLSERYSLWNYPPSGRFPYSGFKRDWVRNAVYWHRVETDTERNPPPGHNTSSPCIAERNLGMR